jgi:hypothetical protein
MLVFRSKGVATPLLRKIRKNNFQFCIFSYSFFMQAITERQVHILIGCADARDLNQVQIDSVNETIKEFRQRGIGVEIHVLRVAGSFVTPDVIMDIKRIVDNTQRTVNNTEHIISYFVHIQSHGHLTDESEKEYVSHIYNMKIVEGSLLNCGMLRASSVGIEIEKFILEAAPKVSIKGEVMQIDTEIELRMLLSEIYAYDGYLGGDWIRGIDYLRTHPRTQRTILQRAIAADVDLKMLRIKITAGLQDYAIHSLIRLDEGEPQVEFWDKMQNLIRTKIKVDAVKSSLAAQADKQEPLAGLLCMPDPRVSSRTYAAQYYRSVKGCGNENDYLPNSVFNMTGMSFDMPLTPFGPYVIAGFFYSVKHLKLTDQMVMGYDHAQTNRIMQKIANDPIMSLIVKKFNVNLMPISQIDFLQNQEFQQKIANIETPMHHIGHWVAQE